MEFRGAWRRLTQPGQDRPYNLLVLSDLHLGQDLKSRKGLNPHGKVVIEPRESRLDRELVRFLDHHATHRAKGLPWRLLLDGDIVDFVSITMTPAPGTVAPFDISESERRDGLAPEEDKCAWKLNRVAERHPHVFDALARFLVAGHEVHVIRGNHDAEFAFEGVQREWTRLLVERCGVAGAGGALRRRLGSRVKFHAWFYLEPGFLFVEHGNAHDRFCLQGGFFDAPPKNRHEKAALQGELDLPLSSKVMRYFVNRYEAAESDLEDASAWTAVQYLAWIFRAGNPLQIAADYLIMVARLMTPLVRNSLTLSRRAARLGSRTLKRVDEQRTAFAQRTLSRFAQNSSSAAHQLSRLAQRPAEESVFDTAQLFYVDRMALGLLALVTAAAALWLLPVLGVKLAALGLVGAGFTVGNVSLARLRKVDAHPLLQTAATRVAQIFGVRYVVMGHSHKPMDEAIGGRARYLNTGTWTNVKSEGLPHVLVVGRAAKLARWTGPAAALEAVAAMELGQGAAPELAPPVGEARPVLA